MNHEMRIAKYEIGIVLALTLIAFGLRVWRLDSIPPGWRDDELINSLVISQKVLDGNLAVYYPDASGHEALYHTLNALFLALFGPTAAGIRLLSAVLGTTAVPLTYLVGKQLWGRWVGFIAAAALTVSFWSLIYSRIGLRHITMPLLTLLAFHFFWRGLQRDWRLEIRDWRDWFNLQSPISNYLLAGIFLALGFYTYFAGRGVPLILLAFGGYLFLFDRGRWRAQWPGWLVMFGVAFLLAIPLIITLNQQPEAEARVAELAIPIVAARDGDFAPLIEYTTTTLQMFHSDGDGEWLYNIPHRPLFSPIGAIFFWSGVLIALYYTLRPLFPNGRSLIPDPQSLPAAFLLLWWLAGIAPGFISVPPASLGHTILAQPAVYLLAAIPIWRLATGDWRFSKFPISNLQSLMGVGLTAVLILSIAARDLPAYFVEWPQRGMVRFLYHADMREMALFLNEAELTDVAVSGLLAGPWAKLALEIDLDGETAVLPRWYNPERAIFLSPSTHLSGYPAVTAVYADWLTPTGTQIGGYQLSEINQSLPTADPTCFVNGLCLIYVNYNADQQILELGWQVGDNFILPDIPLISNPPPPGVYAGARLWVFAQLQDGAGNFLTGNDGLWVDPQTLRPGDIFIQQHWFEQVEGVETAVFGLYDPMTGERIKTADGREFLTRIIGSSDYRNDSR